MQKSEYFLLPLFHNTLALHLLLLSMQNNAHQL